MENKLILVSPQQRQFLKEKRKFYSREYKKDISITEEQKDKFQQEFDSINIRKKTEYLNEHEFMFEDNNNLSLYNSQKLFFNEDLALMQLKENRKEILSRIFKTEDKARKKELRAVFRDINKAIYKIQFNQQDFTEESLKILVDSYKAWLKEDVFLTFRDTEKNEYLFSKAAKRGNSIYKKLVKNKLEAQLSFIYHPKFRNLLLRENNKTKKLETNVIFVTLTTDTKIYSGNRVKAWRNINEDYNRFITRFRKTYGKTWVLRGMESTKKGFPHLHLILICENSFNVFSEYSTQEKQTLYRIKEKPHIANMWASNVDIRAIDNVQKLWSYVVKDIIKQYNHSSKTEQDYLSLALCWIFRKQSYAISGWDGNDLINEVSIIQTQIDNVLKKYPEKKLIFLGITKITFSKQFLEGRRNNKPPNTFIRKLTEDEKRQLSQYLIQKKGGDSNEM